MTSDDAYFSFAKTHADLVLAFDVNLYGDRVVTASSDHRLSVWQRDDDKFTRVDTWRAHDAEVIDVKYNGPLTGSQIGSIGEDGKFCIWQEDVLQPFGSGRRFVKIYQQLSANKVPYMSLDFKNINAETYVALITRDGELTVMEPTNHDVLKEWQVMWMDYLRKTPPQTDETSFHVCWHREKLPAWPAILAGLPRTSLSLAVVMMGSVKIFRTDNNRQFFTAAEIPAIKAIVRDAAWANGSMRGHDTIATVGTDGYARVYELRTPDMAGGNGEILLEESSQRHRGSISQVAPKSPMIRRTQTLKSGIGAGLAGATQGSGKGKDEYDPATGKILQNVQLKAQLRCHNGALWRVSFSQNGAILLTTGDDGVTKMWRQDLNGSWSEFADIDGAKDS
ncbi:hypothetical protein LTR50_000905 [Elasticomyces elasticus]|nr:hypothetical protein LTR50_000905 [Elasticomyces elasticus]